jgi:hypothetical protein
MAGSVIGPVAGSLASGLIGNIGSNKANKQLAAAANAANQVFYPEPFRASSSLFNVSRSGKAALTDFGRAEQRNLMHLKNDAYNRVRNFDRGAFADRLMDASSRVNDKRESQAFARLESKLFNRQGASTGTAQQIADFGADLEDRRYQRSLQAQIDADQFGRERFEDFFRAYGLFNNIDDRRMDIQKLSLDGGRAMLPTTASNPGAYNAGLFAANNTQGFYNGLGGVFGGLARSGVNRLYGGPASSVGGGYVPGSGFALASGLGFGRDAAPPVNGVGSPFYSSIGY